jgi:hypothetical protein
MPKVKVYTDPKPFEKDMHFFIEYTLGTLKGIEDGKDEFLKQMGPKIAAIVGQYIDTMAKMDPESLHHVYEWDKTGMTSARLFKIVPTYTKAGLTFSSVFTQSKTVQTRRGSKVPFRDKAFIMENGITLDIYPNKEPYLKYYDEKLDGWVTSYHSRVENPGGNYVVGSFGSNFRTFFATYLSQSRLMQSGMMVKPFSKAYQRGLRAGMKRRGGRLAGIETGYRWIVGAADIAEVE